MPYVSCIRCGLQSYSAASWSNRDYCTACGAELPRPRHVRPDAAQLRLLRAPRRGARFHAGPPSPR